MVSVDVSSKHSESQVMVPLADHSGGKNGSEASKGDPVRGVVSAQVSDSL